jgi:predicted permease
MLFRMRGSAILAILALALGIGATTTMFGVVDAMIFQPPPFAGSARLTVLFNTRTTPRDGLTRLRWSMSNIESLRSSASSFEDVASFSSALLSISGRGEPEYVQGEVVSPEYFRTLRVTPVSGRAFDAEEGTLAGRQPVAMIGGKLWQRKFGTPFTSGATIVINSVTLTVLGIMPEDFRGLSGKAELWIPPPMAARLTYADYLVTPQNFVSVIARLRDGVTLSQANTELAAIGSRFIGNGSAPGTVWGAVGLSLGKAQVDPALRQSAFLLLAAAACVLLTACFNVASLLLARARTRRREIAIRLAIGSGRGRLVRQLLTEGLVLATAAGALGILMAQWGIDAFARTAPAVVANFRNNFAAIGTYGTPALDARVLLFALAATLGTTLFFALAPALAASHPQLMTALRSDDRGGDRRGRVFAMLVVAETAVAYTLLVSAAQLIGNFGQLRDRRTGFVSGNVLTFWVRPPVSQYPVTSGPATVDRLLAQVQAAPGVESAAVNRCVPFSGCANTVLFLPGQATPPAAAPQVGRHYISADYFRTLGIPILAGRALTPADRAGSAPVAVVNESGARRFWPGEDPIGRRVWFGSTTGPFADPAHAVTIVGMVGDVKYDGVDTNDRSLRADFYTSYLQFSFPDTMLIVKARGAPAALVPAMRTAVAAMDPALPVYDAMTLDERIDSAISQPRFNTTLLSAFAGTALLLAALGVYGMLSYSVSVRMREIGVRVALGAGAGRVINLILGEGLALAAGGAGIGIGASWAVGRIAQGYLPAMVGWDARIMGVSGIILLAVSATAAFVPARRASAVDPIVALRND